MKNRKVSRPAFLARYIAVSAYLISVSGSDASSGWTVIPMLAVIATWWPFEVEGREQYVAYLLGHDRSALLAVLRHEDQGKLVPAEPSDRIPDAHAVDQPAAELGQQLVAHRVTERVVDVLEVIQVDEQHGHDPASRVRGLDEGLRRASRRTACDSAAP